MRRRTDNRTIFMNSTLVAKLNKNRLEEIRISVLRNNKIDIRTYMYFPSEPEPKPTKKGIWLSFKHIPPIIAAFEKYIGDPAREFALEFDQADKERIRVYINDYLNNKIVHIRTFYLKDNEFLPGKGISFPVALIKEMTENFRALSAYDENKK